MEQKFNRTLRLPVEAVPGRDGGGWPTPPLPRAGLKGRGYLPRECSPRAAHGRDPARRHAGYRICRDGLLCRSLMAALRAGGTRRAVEQIRTRFISQGETRFLPNIDALLCRIVLRTGDLDDVDAWYREKARDALHLNVMKRYQYFTQAMAELSPKTGCCAF